MKNKAILVSGLFAIIIIGSFVGYFAYQSTFEEVIIEEEPEQPAIIIPEQPAIITPEQPEKEEGQPEKSDEQPEKAEPIIIDLPELPIIDNDAFEGKYDFYSEDIGDSPKGFYISSPSGINIEVIGEYQEHLKVLKIQDDSKTQSGFITLNFKEGRVKGTFKFYHATTNSNEFFGIQLKDGIFPLIELFVVNGYYKNRKTHTSWDNVKVLHPYTWYYHIIEYDCGTDTFTWKINGEVVLKDSPFYFKGNQIKALYITTSSDAKYIQYLDAITI